MYLKLYSPSAEWNLDLRELKGAKAPVIAFKNKNNNSGQMKYIFYISLSPSSSLYIPFSLSLTGEEGVRTLFTGQRERDKEREREKEGGREKERGREREREGKREEEIE